MLPDRSLTCQVSDIADLGPISDVAPFVVVPCLTITVLCCLQTLHAAAPDHKQCREKHRLPSRARYVFAGHLLHTWCISPHPRSVSFSQAQQTVLSRFFAPKPSPPPPSSRPRGIQVLYNHVWYQCSILFLFTSMRTALASIHVIMLAEPCSNKSQTMRPTQYYS